jgi:hypothetical protein
MLGKRTQKGAAGSVEVRVLIRSVPIIKGASAFVGRERRNANRNLEKLDKYSSCEGDESIER